MGGIVIDIWEKSNFWGAFGSQKGAKNAYGRVTTEMSLELVNKFSFVTLIFLFLSKLF